MHTSRPTWRRTLPVLCLLLATACRKTPAVENASLGTDGTDTVVVSLPGDLPAPTDRETAGQEDLFPLRSLDVKAQVSGPVAHVVLHQVFGNLNKVPVEAVYLFPLPHQAAVHGMTIHTKGRTVRAVIKRRQEARATYEEASRQGKTASLLEQQRPDVFTQSVANLMPGDTIGVDIELDMPLAHLDGRTEFVFPTVVGPRFCPPGKVPDMGKIGAPRLPPGMAAPQTLDLSVSLDAGFPVQDLESPTHAIRSRGKLAGSAWQGAVEVSLAKGKAVPDRDFVLRWKTRKEGTTATLLTDGKGKEGHFLLEIQPPARPDADNTTAKELVFLVDQSGSMNGEPIALVKRAMRRCLETMEPRDRFQIVGFSNSTVLFAPSAVPATRDNVARGLSWIDGLQANGGTYMLEGLKEAMKTPHEAGTLRILAMMTDGYIGNEDEILGYVARNLGEGNRAFAFGTGGSVNRSFLYEFGQAGRGKTEFVTLDEDPAAAVDRFRKGVDRPVLTDIRLDWHGLPVSSLEPERLPDLFEGEPLLIAGKFETAAKGSVTVHGTIAGKPIALEVPVDFGTAQERPAISSLWARARIASWSRGGDYRPSKDTVEQLTKLALDYRLMSPWTSFVAVSDTVVNQGGKQKTVDVPLPLPRGVSESALGGGADRMMASRTVAWPASSPAMTMNSSVLAGGSSQMGAIGGIGLGGAGGSMRMAKMGVPLGGTGTRTRGTITPPKPVDVELGGEAGTRSAESILRVIRAHIGGFRYTYEKFLRTDSTLKGKITFKFTIAASGDIVAIGLESSSTGSKALDAELMNKARRMRFDEVEHGNVTVTYTFDLKPETKGKP